MGTEIRVATVSATTTVGMESAPVADQDRRSVAPIEVGRTVVPLEIVLVNDDGFDAEGIEVLRDALLADGHTVRVVAPLEQQSGKGTSIDTASIFQPVTITEFRPGDFSVDGTPVTTTLAALEFLATDPAPDLLISGINEGANIGQIAASSGTVSGAVTAILRDVPAIAISAGLDFAEAGAGFPSLGETYVASADLVAALVADLSLRKAQGAPLLPEGTGLNVNVPSSWDAEAVAFTTVTGSDGLSFVFTQETPGEDDLSFGAGFGSPSGDPESEGINFASGAATVSVMDGDWSTPDAIREALEERLDDLSFETPSITSRPLEILLVNDDGFDAPGIAEMAGALRAAGHTVNIVAPASPQSGQGTNIDAAAIGSVIAVTEFAPGDFSVESTPVNVTVAGLTALLNGTPDLVVSGINEGENTGLTTISSGTVSAAVAALYNNVPAIAVSAGLDLAEAADGFPSTEIAYEVGGRFTVDLIADLLATAGDGPLLPEGVGLSVNVPTGEIAGIAFTRLDDVTSLEIGFGPVPGGAGPVIRPGAPNGDPLSEGSRFIDGNITVTPIDGNYTAGPETRDLVEGLIERGPGFTAFLGGSDGNAFLGVVEIPSFTEFDGTVVGGLSGIAYDAGEGVYRAVSDDRSGARFYELSIDLADGAFGADDVTFLDVVALTTNSAPLDAINPDPEGIALAPNGDLFISSERDFLGNPAIYSFDREGALLGALPVDTKFQPTPDGASGVRNNLGFESLTITPDHTTLYTATESALAQDGDVATRELGAAARIIRYDLDTGLPVAEYVYEVDPIAAEPQPADAFADSGLVELLAIDNEGTLLALERSFSTGAGDRGYTGKLYLVRTQGATDVMGTPALPVSEDDGALAINVDAPVQKDLLLDLGDLGISIDNVEGMSLGPRLADGRQALVIVSDDNFSGFGPQATQFIALALDIDRVPTVAPAIETPDELRYANIFDTEEGPDPDDPALWLNGRDAAASVVITAMKEGGLRVYDLAGEELERIEPDGIRYNNVDVLYDVDLGGRARDLAVASDRANDTLTIFRIGRDGALRDITSKNIPETIFGVDDGEATAYGLAAYTSPVDGKSYVFVTQADGASIAQLELTADGNRVSFEKVRELTLPVPEGADPADFQSEGITIDRETGIGYVTVEDELGLLAFEADPAGSDAFRTVASIDSGVFEPDLEGVSIHYGPNGAGLLVVSSQGDSSFSVFDRASEAHLGSFAIRGEGDIDGVEESDGLEIFSGALPDFGSGLLVTQDGSNEVQVVFGDPEDGEIQNFNVNFKYTDLGQILTLFGAAANPGFDPRALVPQTLPNGAASGDVDQDSVVLWTRSLARGEVTFKVTATDPAGAETLVTAEVTDPNAPVKVEIDGLTPGTDYRYTVTDAAGATAEGAFETAAAANSFAGLTFGVTGDWRGELAPYAAISNAAGKSLDFFVMHGDTIYADFPSPFLPKPQAETLEEFRIKHDEVYSDRGDGTGWTALRESTAIFATIDDHEVTNDFAGGAPAALDPRFAETEGLVNDTRLYEDGMQAFQDYNPIRDEFYGDTGDDRTSGEREIYRARQFGDDAAVFVLDQRSFRDAPLAAADITDPADIGRFLAESFDPARTLLGETQLEDLKADLLAAEANGVTWKFVHTPEPIQNLGIYNADAWEGYAAERNALLGFIAENDIENVVFVAADIHGTFVNNLTYQASPFGPQIASSAFEITTGSVAFDPPFGPAAVGVGADLGILTPEQVAFYDSLPIAPDNDGLPNDRDGFLTGVFDGILAQGGFDPLGLDQNLAIADGLIDAELLQGGYVSANTFGWTEFDIDAKTQALTVTTYGIPGYSEQDLAEDPAGVAARTPQIVSQFVVEATNLTGLEAKVLATFQGDSDPLNDDSPEGASEVVAYEDGTLYVTNGNLDRIDIFQLDADEAPSMMAGENGFAVDPVLTIGETLVSSGVFNDLNMPEDGYTPVGVLDGLGAYALDDGTVRVFANHELLSSRGNAYAVSDGAGGSFEMTGARISYFDIDRETREITDGGLAYDKIYDASGEVAADISFLQEGFGGFSRFCSAILVEPEQFGPGRGLVDRIFFAGEEDGGFFNPVGGAEWALDVETGEMWQVPAMGRGGWENVTEIDTGSTDRVAFILADDTAPFDFDGDGTDEAAPLFLYVGQKDPSGDFLARNGLRDGTLHVWVSETGETLPSQFNGPGAELDGRWVAVDNTRNPSQASENGATGYDEYGYPTQGNLWLQARDLGAFGFSRPEDVATNPGNGAEFTLASTGVDTYDIDPDSGNGADTFGTIYTMAVDFADPANPSGMLKILYDGDADPDRALRSPDNLDWADDGLIYVQEDKAEDDTASGDEVLFGPDAANPHEAGIVRLDPLTGTPYRVAGIDRSVLLDPTTSGTPADLGAGEAGNWESSGIIDVSNLFDEEPGSLFLFDVQAHGIADQEGVNPDSRISDGDLVEGGQLAFLEGARSIDLRGLPGYAGVQSVAVSGGLVAAAISTENRTDPLPAPLDGDAVLGSSGLVAFFDAHTGALLRSVEVGNLPDHITFSKDGATLVVANEGEFNGDSEVTQDPAGSISIIDVAGDFAVTAIDFAALAGFEEAARDAGIRVGPGRSLALDLEPEYIAISPDQATAYVTLQENNTVAVIDLASGTLTRFLPLGTVDHSLPGNEIDPDDNGVIDIRSFEKLVGLRMPDAITAFEIDGATYFATANEGDGRGDAPDWDEERVGSLPEGAIDPSVDTAGLERLTISTVDGDTDGDGDIDVLHAFGSRSFTIFDEAGDVVFDSGGELAELIARIAPERFQDDDGEPDENRSDAKGVEPEAIAVGEVGGEHFAFIGLERDSGIAVYNISTPQEAFLVDYIDGFAAGNLGPEVLQFVPEDESETGAPLLFASYEISGTTVAYELNSATPDADVFAFI